MTLSGRLSEAWAVSGLAVIVSNESSMPCDTSALTKLARLLFAELRIHPEVELGIRLVEIDEMTRLHVQWMDEPGPTDVLSFPMDELRSAPIGVEPEPGLLGDIVLCPKVAAAQASEFLRTLDEELQFLTIHGVLHLIGYDHMTDAEYAQMFGLQDELLAAWNLQNAGPR
ncbi:MAG: rRNA maturation RNase YbeY [Candidatus Nanopelagicales bacterium]|nr:rRNA maturation RNase YbeY [Candidatus Nanopelagicales bacterium]